MATRAQYGRTWWGERWLQALSQIDFDNRLPRGRSYANRGAVRKLEVASGKLQARVQGSRPSPYQVEIQVPPLTAADAARLVGRLADAPGLIARLLNRELDPAVLDAAQQLKIAVFPSRWSDLQMHCSCPDWAVPCKHLAAVIYLLSQQIDADPFLVFSLRGVDLPALLQPHGVGIRAAAGAALPGFAEALFGADAGSGEAVAGVADAVAVAVAVAVAGAGAGAGADAGADADAVPAPPALWPAAWSQLDFTTIPDLRETLWRLLPANPVFHRGGDFRALAQQTMARVARWAEAAMEPASSSTDVEAGSDPGVDAAALLPTGSLQITVDDKGVVEVLGVESGNQPITSWPVLLDALAALAALPPARLADLPVGLAALCQLRLLALHLLTHGAVLPQLLAVDKHSVGLRWLPAELDPQVRDLLLRAATTLPEGLVWRRLGRKRLPLSAPLQLRLLLSLLLDGFIHSAAAVAPTRAAGVVQTRLLEGKLPQLFFVSGRARFDGPGEAAWPGSIQSWLARLHLARLPHAPVLELGESARSGKFSLSIAVADEQRSLAPPTPLATVLTDPDWAARRMAVLQTVALLAEFHPPLNTHVRAGARKPLAIAAAELPAFLFEALPAIRLLGVRALLPKALERLWRPRLSMQLRAAPGDGPGGLKSAQLFDFDWQVALGAHQLSPAEFETLVGDAEGVIRFRGEYVYLDPAALAQLRERLARPPKVAEQELLRIALTGEYDGAPVGLDPAVCERLAQLRSEEALPLPTGLLAQLRPYQRRGFSWLARNAELGLGSVIADDMGLGKTVQVIALLLRLQELGDLDKGRALVIVPTSLLSNWQRELARFAPGLSVAVFHGVRRALGTRAAARPDVLLTTYGLARSDAARLKALDWRIVVVDEAQNLKNPAAAQTRAVKGIAAASHVAMSGTPVENRLSEYWSIVDFVQHGYLGGLTHFGREFGTPIQTHHDAAAADRLRKALAPLLLRRLKSDKSIISDLPDKIEQNQHCTLSPAQVALYEGVVREGLRSIAGESDTFQRQGLVLQMILALKQICNHPAQYLKQEVGAPLESGKVERLFDLLDEIDAAHEKVLLFTQFRAMGALLQDWLRARSGGRAPLFLHGGLARKRRDELVERFQNEPSDRVFLLSLKAGGTGLNLTAASHVVHFDLWWNPAVEAQATDRAYRIGQQRKVQVHRFITRDSFEERIDAMIQAKRELAELAVGTGESWIGQLPPEELKALFEFGPRAGSGSGSGAGAGAGAGTAGAKPKLTLRKPRPAAPS